MTPVHTRPPAAYCREPWLLVRVRRPSSASSRCSAPTVSASTFSSKDSTPYIAIRQRRPDLVVLCFAPDDDEACQVLQMLQLDPATRTAADPHLRQWRGLRYNPEPMASDKRDSERVELLGSAARRGNGFSAVCSPPDESWRNAGGDRLPAATGFPSRLPSHPRRTIRRRQGPHRPFAHQRRRPGHHHLSLGHRIHRAVGARRRRHPAVRRRARQEKEKAEQ